MTTLPSKVTAGEVIVCCEGHEVGRVRATLSLAQSITADTVEVSADAVSKAQPERITCFACGSPVARVLRGGRLSVRLGRGWVS